MAPSRKILVFFLYNFVFGFIVCANVKFPPKKLALQGNQTLVRQNVPRSTLHLPSNASIIDTNGPMRKPIRPQPGQNNVRMPSLPRAPTTPTQTRKEATKHQTLQKVPAFMFRGSASPSPRRQVPVNIMSRRHLSVGSDGVQPKLNIRIQTVHPELFNNVNETAKSASSDVVEIVYPVRNNESFPLKLSQESSVTPKSTNLPEGGTHLNQMNVDNFTSIHEVIALDAINITDYSSDFINIIAEAPSNHSFTTTAAPVDSGSRKDKVFVVYAQTMKEYINDLEKGNTSESSGVEQIIPQLSSNEKSTTKKVIIVPLSEIANASNSEQELTTISSLVDATSSDPNESYLSATEDLLGSESSNYPVSVIRSNHYISPEVRRIKVTKLYKRRKNQPAGKAEPTITGKRVNNTTGQNFGDKVIASVQASEFKSENLSDSQHHPMNYIIMPDTIESHANSSPSNKNDSIIFKSQEDEDTDVIKETQSVYSPPQMPYVEPEFAVSSHRYDKTETTPDKPKLVYEHEDQPKQQDVIPPINSLKNGNSLPKNAEIVVTQLAPANFYHHVYTSDLPQIKKVNPESTIPELTGYPNGHSRKQEAFPIDIRSSLNSKKILPKNVNAVTLQSAPKANFRHHIFTTDLPKNTLPILSKQPHHHLELTTKHPNHFIINYETVPEDIRSSTESETNLSENLYQETSALAPSENSKFQRLNPHQNQLLKSPSREVDRPETLTQQNRFRPAHEQINYPTDHFLAVDGRPDLENSLQKTSKIAQPNLKSPATESRIIPQKYDTSESPNHPARYQHSTLTNNEPHYLNYNTGYFTQKTPQNHYHDATQYQNNPNQHRPSTNTQNARGNHYQFQNVNNGNSSPQNHYQYSVQFQNNPVQNTQSLLNSFDLPKPEAHFQFTTHNVQQPDVRHRPSLIEQQHSFGRPPVRQQITPIGQVDRFRESDRQQLREQPANPPLQYLQYGTNTNPFEPNHDVQNSETIQGKLPQTYNGQVSQYKPTEAPKSSLFGGYLSFLG